MNFFQSLPPPPQPLLTTTTSNQLSQLSDTTSSATSSSSSSLSTSIIILSIVISSAILLSATIYLLLRFISKRFHHSSRTYATPETPRSHVAAAAAPAPAPLSELNALPLFKFSSLSVSGALTGGDCAVCLSKFEPNDQLRLLPLCCHAFHARCIDTWLSKNQTCPLCRSTVYPTDDDVASKIKTSEITRGGGGGGGGSFRIEIGSVSRRSGGEGGGRGRSFPVGSFEYIVDEGVEIAVPVASAEKEAAPPGESLGGEGGGRNWLKDYVDRLGSFSFSSQSSSFRGSGRFFAGGSSRRNDVVVNVDEDLEANHRVGEEISELFRWISGV